MFNCWITVVAAIRARETLLALVLVTTQQDKSIPARRYLGSRGLNFECNVDEIPSAKAARASAA